MNNYFGRASAVSVALIFIICFALVFATGIIALLDGELLKLDLIKTFGVVSFFSILIGFFVALPTYRD